MRGREICVASKTWRMERASLKNAQQDVRGGAAILRRRNNSSSGKPAGGKANVKLEGSAAEYT